MPAKQDVPRKFISVEELAAQIGDDRQTILAAIRRGKIPATRLTDRGKWKIPADTADRMVAEARREIPRAA